MSRDQSKIPAGDNLTDEPASPAGASDHPHDPVIDRTGDFPILRSAVELFVARDRHRRNEIKVFGELVEKFLNDAPLGDRRYVSSLLAPRADAPHRVIVKLATDEPSVAAPVLTKSPLLSHADLMRIAQTGSREHRMSIAARSDLRQDVVEILIAAGDDGMIDRLVANGNAPITEAARDDILASAESTPERTAVYACRSDTNAESLAQLYLHLDPDLRARALVVCEARAALEAAMPGAGEIDSRSQGGYAAELERLALNCNLEAFQALLSGASGLSPEHVHRIVDDPYGDPLVLLLASLGMNEASIVRVLLFAIPQIGGDYASVKRLAELRSAIEERTARFICRQWVAAGWAGSEQLDLPIASEPAPLADQAERRKTPLAQRRLDNDQATEMNRTATDRTAASPRRRGALPIFGGRRR